MPKKFATENTKAATARARRAAVKEQETVRKQQALEDALWQEDDKLVLRKMQRKEDKTKKKEEQASKKAEAKAILETEMATVKSKVALPPTRMTRAQIQTIVEKTMIDADKPKIETHLTTPLEENVNRLDVDGEEARSVTEAISILSVKDVPEDKHPERRLKAAYAAFEEKHMPRIKQENSTLRLSQLKQILRKEWMKSPENPTNSQF